MMVILQKKFHRLAAGENPAFLQVSKNSVDTLLSLKCLMKAFVSFSLITGIVRTGFANTVICSTSFLLSFASLCCLHIFYHPRESICNFFFSIPFDFCGFSCFSLRYFHDLMPPFLFFVYDARILKLHYCFLYSLNTGCAMS